MTSPLLGLLFSLKSRLTHTQTPKRRGNGGPVLWSGGNFTSSSCSFVLLVANVHRTVAIAQKGSTSVPKLLSLTRANLRSPYRSNPRFCTSASMKRLNTVKSKVDIPWLLDRSSRTNNSIETREHVSACGRRCNATSSTTSITPPIHNSALPISDGHIPETSPACGPFTFVSDASKIWQKGYRKRFPGK